MIIKVKPGESVVKENNWGSETFELPCDCHEGSHTLRFTISLDPEWHFFEVDGLSYNGNIFKRTKRAIRHIFSNYFEEPYCASLDWADKPPTELIDLANWILDTVKKITKQES